MAAHKKKKSMLKFSQLQVAFSMLLRGQADARQVKPLDIFSPKLKDQLDEIEKDSASTPLLSFISTPQSLNFLPKI